MGAATNRQIADAFREARVKLLADRHDFICNALPKTDSGNAAAAVIATRLGESSTLFSWLIAQGHITNDELHDLPRHEKTAFRISWLDALIEEFDPTTGSTS